MYARTRICRTLIAVAGFKPPPPFPPLPESSLFPPPLPLFLAPIFVLFFFFSNDIEGGGLNKVVGF